MMSRRWNTPIFGNDRNDADSARIGAKVEKV
jgi:hypothetical protein